MGDITYHPPKRRDGGEACPTCHGAGVIWITPKHIQGCPDCSPGPVETAERAAEADRALRQRIVRENLQAIVRYTKGDRLPTIHRLAEEALRYVPLVERYKAEVGDSYGRGWEACFAQFREHLESALTKMIPDTVQAAMRIVSARGPTPSLEEPQPADKVAKALDAAFDDLPEDRP